MDHHDEPSDENDLSFANCTVAREELKAMINRFASENFNVSCCFVLEASQSSLTTRCRKRPGRRQKRQRNCQV